MSNSFKPQMAQIKASSIRDWVIRGDLRRSYYKLEVRLMNDESKTIYTSSTRAECITVRDRLRSLINLR